MRILLALVIILLVLGFIAFSISNAGTQVTVTLFSVHPNVELVEVVLYALAVGAISVGLIAVAEGTKTRLDNRRLRRELHKLETEVNYLRTQPPVNRQEPLLPAAEEASAGSAIEEEAPEAPVYDTTSAEANPEDDSPDDDIYSGGRAV